MSLPRLSPREREILDLLLHEDSEKGIAATLGLSVHTVHTYLQRLYRKLEVRTKTQLIVKVYLAKTTTHK
jgi:DNA-binding CsgD family transcriptional regulator